MATLWPVSMCSATLTCTRKREVAWQTIGGDSGGDGTRQPACGLHLGLTRRGTAYLAK